MIKTLEISGKKLCFQKGGFYEHLGEASQSEPFEWLSNWLKKFDKTEDKKFEIMSQFKDLAILAYAGINLNADLEDQKNISLDSVKRWVRTLDFEEHGKIVTAVVEMLIAQSKINENAGESVSQPVS